jgi:hypothetical protein
LRRIFSRIPFMRKLNWRNHWSKRCLWNYFRCQQRINASGLQYMAPENVYWEYSAGIGNIFKVFRIDFAWRKLFKHTRYAAILSKRIFWILFLELFPAVHYIFYAKPWHKRMSFHLG